MEELRGQVEEQEAQLRESVVELEHVARRAVDVRHWISSRPYLWTAGAFAIGAWLGGRRP
jgi:hypothetical protein